MKHLFLFFATLCLSLQAHSNPPEESIVGKFELKMGKPGNSVEVHLECENESNCTFITVSQWKTNPPQQTKEALSKVHLIDNLTEATSALNYTINQQSLPIKNEEYAESIRKLKPILSTNPSINKCWDLNYPAPTYMLACTLSNSPASNPPIYLFGTLLASCGEAFCRYVINPMERTK